jgi:hypothetical protein
MHAAESASEAGNSPTDMAILISSQGSIRMVANSDWPLESLKAYHGSQTAYRVSKQNDKVRLDGREDGRTVTFESENPKTAARLILGGYPTYSFLPAASRSAASLPAAG